jgi:hypothetical protein
LPYRFAAAEPVKVPLLRPVDTVPELDAALAEPFELDPEVLAEVPVVVVVVVAAVASGIDVLLDEALACSR